jgi:ribosome-associated protein
VLLDFVDIVVHVQHTEERSFYGLDRLWKDCPSIDFPEAEMTDAGGAPFGDRRSERGGTG